MKWRWIIIIAIAIALGIIIFWAVSPSAQTLSAMKTVTVHVGGAAVQAEVADTPEAREKGLSGRTALALNVGMLFVFDGPGRTGFWMKGMRFPLDFIYLKDDAVVDLRENVVVPSIPSPFFPSTDFDAVLEMNAGWVAAQGIRVGSPAQY
jgi:hypothetical protein